MDLFETIAKNPIVQEYIDPKQFQITPWVKDPIGFQHPFVFEFEKKFFDKTYAQNIYAWMNQWWWLSIIYSIVYVVLIYFGRSLMENRERFELRIPLILWNLSLAAFSIFGVIRCVPEMIYGLDKLGLQYTICDHSNIYGVTGYWSVENFLFSSFPRRRIFSLVQDNNFLYFKSSGINRYIVHRFTQTKTHFSTLVSSCNCSRLRLVQVG